MKHLVGIFSRQHKSDFGWLVGILSSSDFIDCVQDVRPSVICNGGSVKFIEDVSWCSLGIIYHTKNRGRINVTDIQGSLYDEELRTLNNLLGRDNVIVVIDDVEDNSHEEKVRILKLQPSIEKLASDLLLISKANKQNTKKLMTKVRLLTPFCSASALQGEKPLRDPDPQIGRQSSEEKLMNITKVKHHMNAPNPLHNLNPTPLCEILKPLRNNTRQEASFSNEDRETESHYVDCRPIKDSLAAWDDNITYEMSSSNMQVHNTRHDYENQKLPSNTETEDIYVTPVSWNTSDKLYQQMHNEMPKTPYKRCPLTLVDNKTSKMKSIPENFEKPQYIDFPEIQKTSLDNEIYENLPEKQCFAPISEKLHNKCYPLAQFDDDLSKMRNLERLKELPSIESPKDPFFNKSPETSNTCEGDEASLERPKNLSDDLCRGEDLDMHLQSTNPKPPSALRSQSSQSGDIWSNVVDEFKQKLKPRE